MSSLVKKSHCNGDPNVKQKELELVYGLRDS